MHKYGSMSNHKNSVAVKNGGSDAAKQSPLLSRAQVAALLGVCTHTVQRMERAGLLKSVRFNRRLLRYRDEDVQRSIAEAGDLARVQASHEKGGAL